VRTASAFLAMAPLFAVTAAIKSLIAVVSTVKASTPLSNDADSVENEV